MVDRILAAKPREVSALARELDHLVYELYELTDDEIEIVANSGQL